MVGNITNVSDKVNNTSYQYDSQNRVTKKTVENNGSINYQYDIALASKAGPGMARQYYHEEKITDSSNKTITKTYDGTNKLVSVGDGKDKVKYNYNANGTLKETVFPDQSIEGYSYNKDMTIKTMGHKDSSGKVEWACSYEYDNNKNVTFFGSKEGTKSYGYDTVNRLKYQTQEDGTRTEYTYDKAGNRETEKITKDNKTSTNNYEYDKENRLIKKVDRSTGKTLETSFIYDSNGNLLYQDTSDPNTNEVYNKRNLVYDNYNRLVQVKENDKLLETNKYNYESLRVEKEAGGKTTKYLYDGTDVLLELDSNNNINARNVYGKKLLSREVGDEKGYYRYNGHGDVIGVKGNNKDLASYNYDAFGNLTEESGSFDNPYRYSGYVYDKEVNYYYLQSRMYDPVEGRFVQQDSYRGDTNNPLSLNLYTYCENNPLIYNDPNGHWPQWITNGVNWVKDTANSAINWVKDTYNDVKNFVSSTVNTVKNTVSKATSSVVNYVKKLDIPKLASGVIFTVGGYVSATAGIGIAAMPVPGARLVGGAMIAGGITTLSYGVGETLDSLFGVNPLRSFAVDILGMSNETYDFIGLIAASVCSAGMETSGPWLSGGTTKEAPKTSKNSSPNTQKQSLDKPEVMIKGVYDKGVSKASDVSKYSNLDKGVNFSNKASEHMGESGRQVPIQTLQDAIKYGEALPDPRGSSATMYYTTMAKSGKPYNLEVLYDKASNTVHHFEYARKAMGNLPRIKK